MGMHSVRNKKFTRWASNRIKKACHNAKMNDIAKDYSNKVALTETEAENRFYDISVKKGLNLTRQFRINIYNRSGYLIKFYFADFCDELNKIVFEVDGGYHFTEEQIKKDEERDRNMKRMGYKVFRITNEDVMNGKSTQFLLDAYKSLGIRI